MLIKINEDLCTGCGKCEDICETRALRVNKESGKVEFNQYRCAGCGACIDECKDGALLYE